MTPANTIQDPIAHYRNPETGQILCGAKGLSLDPWPRGRQEFDNDIEWINCPECMAKLPRRTHEQVEASFHEALKKTFDLT